MRHPLGKILNDLWDALQHKSPIIEALQDSMSELQEHFAESYRSRVESDEAEEMEPCSASVAAALDVSSQSVLISHLSPRQPSTCEGS